MKDLKDFPVFFYFNPFRLNAFQQDNQFFQVCRFRPYHKHIRPDRATQNEVDIEDAKMMAANGVKYYIEVSNMPTTAEAQDYIMAQENMIIAPSKAVNAGGVCVSGLEMSQNIAEA